MAVRILPLHNALGTQEEHLQPDLAHLRQLEEKIDAGASDSEDSVMAIKRCAQVSVVSRPRKLIRLVVKPSRRFDNPYLPEDLIFNILVRLPPKSVIRFKSICKVWRDIISAPCFINAHLECSKKRPSLLMVPAAYHNLWQESRCFRMDFYKYRIGDEAELMHLKEFPKSTSLWTSPLHCNGLILISTLTERMMICNPATKEFVKLPRGSYNVHKRNSRVGFGYDTCSNKYKVARFFYQRSESTSDPVCKFEVLTLGTKVWRQTVDDPPYPILGRTPVHVSGSIYWTLGSTKSCPDPPYAFLRFNLCDENFSLVPYPPSYLPPVSFIDSESELCCLCFCSRTLKSEIWTLSVGQQNHQWNRRCAADIPPDLVVVHPQDWSRRLLKVVLHGKSLFLQGRRKVCQYKIQSSRIEKIASGAHDIGSCDPVYLQKHVVLHLTNYVESLVRIAELYVEDVKLHALPTEKVQNHRKRRQTARLVGGS